MLLAPGVVIRAELYIHTSGQDFRSIIDLCLRGHGDLGAQIFNSPSRLFAFAKYSGEFVGVGE